MFYKKKKRKKRKKTKQRTPDKILKKEGTKKSWDKNVIHQANSQ
jgi:hypothetical protein